MTNWKDISSKEIKYKDDPWEDKIHKKLIEHIKVIRI